MLEKVTHFASLLRNNITSSFNDKPFFCSKMTNFHCSLGSGVLRHLLELRRHMVLVGINNVVAVLLRVYYKYLELI